MSSVTCVKFKKGWFKDTVRLRSDGDSRACYGSMLGDRTFCLDDGEEITVSISKNAMAEKGETYKLSTWLKYCDPFDFPWYWG